MAFIYAMLAVRPCEPSDTFTGVVINTVNTTTIVHTGGWRAIFIVYFTVCSREP